APVEERTREEDAEDEQSEDARARRDVGKGNGPTGVEAERPAELLLVAELLQVADVHVMCGFHVLPLPWVKPTAICCRNLPPVACGVNARARRTNLPYRHAHPRAGEAEEGADQQSQDDGH